MVKREAITDGEELTRRLTEAKETRMYASGNDSGTSREEYLSGLVSDAMDSMELMFPEFQKPDGLAVIDSRVDLGNLSSVCGAAWRFLSGCVRSAVLPNFSLFCVLGLGRSRQYIYKLMQKRQDKVTDFLENFQTLCAGLTETASMDRKISEATAIFSLKNSGTGYTDRAELSVANSGNKVDVFESGDPEQIAKRYLAGAVGSIDDGGRD